MNLISESLYDCGQVFKLLAQFLYLGFILLGLARQQEQLLYQIIELFEPRLGRFQFPQHRTCFSL